ncbi:MAG TPA: ATP-binding protein [Chryseosolibacter sp.]|nr:ATP-binding protein [Chryseosolibacter sp.]
MILKRFNALVIIRLILLFGNVLIIASIFGDKRLFFNQVILCTILVVQIYELLRFINHTNRELSRFFLAIKHSDFSVTFRQASLGSSFRELQESLSLIIDSYKQVKIEKEAQFHLLQMLVNQIQVGIIVSEDDDIVFMNPSAEKILGVSGIKNWRILTQLNPDTTAQLEQLGDQNRKLLEIKVGSEVKFITTDVSSMIVLNKKQKLITFQEINAEIEQKEIEAWHKLIRILTHEIMNSVTPIASLSETMQMILEHKDGTQRNVADLRDEQIGDIRFSLNTIRKRSDGLLNFVENYRKLSRVPTPEFQVIILREFVESILKLIDEQVHKKGVVLSVDIKSEAKLFADPVLVEQVLINLLVNAIHAVADVQNPVIQIRHSESESNSFLAIADNGKGITQKEIGQIFIPFFSTKRDGSGIGLSLSKQIMAAHGGSIKVESEPGVGTTMTLRFRSTHRL